MSEGDVMPECGECGERHDPTLEPQFNGALCDLQTEDAERIERECPYHKVLTKGTLRIYYDTHRAFLDCGVTLDYGYGYYQLSPELEAIEKKAKRERARLAAAARAARIAVTP